MNLSKHKRWRAYRVIAKQKLEQTYPCVNMQQKSMESWRGLIHRMIKKQQVKNEQIKRKQTCFLFFGNVFKFQENKFKIVQRICRK